MGKILALDIGDQWTGIAVSDTLGFFAKPYTTVESSKLNKFLSEFCKAEAIDKIIIGYPKTMKGTESLQTKKVLETKERLASLFKNIQFLLWDERLSSKRAEAISAAKTKEQKLKSHAIAAAFILDSYLLFSSSQKNI